MRIFRLQPIELRNPSWVALSWRHSTVVRAATVARARAVAQRAFIVGTPTSEFVAPWTDERLVKYFYFDGSGYGSVRFNHEFPSKLRINGRDNSVSETALESRRASLWRPFE